MSLCRNALAIAMLASLVQAAIPPQPALSQSTAPPAPAGAMRVTTDTPEYCDSLAERVTRAERARPQTAPQIEELAQEGRHMCGVGLIRAGLVRLRRALMLLRVEQ